MTIDELLEYARKAKDKGRAELRSRINKEIRYAQGRDDRACGKGAMSTNGVYLNGYYSEGGGVYYVTNSELAELNKPTLPRGIGGSRQAGADRREPTGGSRSAKIFSDFICFACFPCYCFNVREANNARGNTMATKTTNKAITGKHPVRNDFSSCSTGNVHGKYYETKRDAVHAFESVLNKHGFYVDWENFTNFANDDGRAMLEFHSEGREYEGHALLTWFRMESGRYEIIGYIT